MSDEVNIGGYNGQKMQLAKLLVPVYKHRISPSVL